MVNFSNNTFSTLKKLVNQKLFKKILIISGKKSYFEFFDIVTNKKNFKRQRDLFVTKKK